MTESALQVSPCVDCGVTVLGERPRCPRCHDDHSDRLAKIDVEIATVRRSAGRVLAGWFVALQVVGAIVLGLVLAARGCR